MNFELEHNQKYINFKERCDGSVGKAQDSGAGFKPWLREEK